MNRHVYFFELRRELSFMDSEDLESAVRFFEELIADAGEDNEAEALKNLGSPTALAAEIRAEYSDGVRPPSGLDLMVPESGAGESSEPKSSWQGEHYRGPNPPWRNGDSDGGVGSGAEGSDGSETGGDGSATGSSGSEREYNEEERDRAERWSRMAEDWGRRVGKQAGEWTANPDERSRDWSGRAGDFGRRAGRRAGDWANYAQRQGEKWAQWAEENRKQKGANGSNGSNDWAQRERYNDTGKYRDTREYDRGERRYPHIHPLVMVLLVIIAAPLIIGMVTAAASVLIALATAGIAMIASGIGLVAGALFGMFPLHHMLVSCGAGLLLVSLGLMIFIGNMAMGKAVIRLVKRIVRRRGDDPIEPNAN